MSNIVNLFQEVNKNNQLNSELENEQKNKQFLKDYLVKAEGADLHYNDTEKGFTTPLGVYSVKHEKSEPVLYAKQLAKKYGININNKNNIKLFNQKITQQERKALQDKSFKYLYNKFSDKKLNRNLTKDEALVYFSLGVNGGKKNATKYLQDALGIKADGFVGNQTINALKSNKDRKIIKPMLESMNANYNRLIRLNPTDYGKYRDGWKNRLTELAKITKTEGFNPNETYTDKWERIYERKVWTDWKNRKYAEEHPGKQLYKPLNLKDFI